MSIENDMDAYSQTKMWEAKTKYEVERRKTELALAKVKNKGESRRNFVNRVTHLDFVGPILFFLGLFVIIAGMTYGLTKPTDPAEIQHKKELAEQCFEAGHIWDDDYTECEK